MNSLLDSKATLRGGEAKEEKGTEKEKEKERESEKEREKGKETFSVRFTNVKEANGNEKEVSMANGGKVIISTDKCWHTLITSKHGIKKGSIGYFQVRNIKAEYPPCVGIVERYDSDAFQFLSHPNCVLSYSYYGRGSLRYCKGGQHFGTLQEKLVKWEEGETIKMKVDLVKFQLTFYKENNEKVGKSLRIKERDVYYPGVQILRDSILEIVD